MSADGPVSTSGSGRPMEKDLDTSGRESEANQPSTSAFKLSKELDHEKAAMAFETNPMSELDNEKTYEIEDLETLMAEIGNVRNGLRLMPDFQRREMAAKLAMKMAAMFGDSSAGEEDLVD
ncbi:uncharacterized protein LOC121804820 [Salvia splendens]|uniref:uncharacterized protein LOC121804820 n=1 Tax=Salvia splendens TaxID=180675 RepID=UPI001C2646DF|nr:uncharacterized protein LOC121804820 [Salvia splendens]